MKTDTKNSDCCRRHPKDEPSLDDFSQIVTHPGFIDKSLLIKALFENTSKVLITAPRRFGKSTNLSMVKRFLEIEVDSNGKPVKTVDTFNYKLFSEKKLKIFEHEQFCKQHLGKHPVMLIDYKPLCEVIDFKNMLSAFKLIIKKTYECHSYLLNVKNFWSGNLKLDIFKSYLELDTHKSLDIDDVKCAFIFLADVLHTYFGRRVFLLLDEYDAYFNIMIFNNPSQMTRIKCFVQSTTAELLKLSDHIDHALLTGILRLSCESLPLTYSQCINNITHHKFLNDHPFCIYYGLTSEELDKLLRRFVKDDSKRSRCKRAIDKYFNGYKVVNQKTKIYSIWSVLQYFKYNNKVHSHCNRDKCITSLKYIFQKGEISEKAILLLFRKSVEVDIYKSFSKANIVKLQDSSTSSNKDAECCELLFIFLYHLGFLTLAKENIGSNISLKIPNQETYFQFAKVLERSLELKYNIDPLLSYKFQTNANSFSSNEMTDDQFVSFCQSLHDLLIKSNYTPSSNSDLSTMLFILFARKFSDTKAESLTDSSSFQNFMSVNEHGIALYIQTNVSKHKPLTFDDITVLASINQLRYNNVFRSFENSLHYDLRGKIFISIYCNFDKKVTMAYSVSSKINKEEIQKPKIISSSIY